MTPSDPIPATPIRPALQRQSMKGRLRPSRLLIPFLVVGCVEPSEPTGPAGLPVSFQEGPPGACAPVITDVEPTGDEPSALATAARILLDDDLVPVIVAEEGARSVSSFRLDPVTGGLTLADTEPTDGAPVAAALTESGHAVVATRGNAVQAYRLDPATGLLTLNDTEPTGGSGPTDMATSGEHVVITHDDGRMSSFRLDPVSGVLLPTDVLDVGEGTTAVDLGSRDVGVAANAGSQDLVPFRLDPESGVLIPTGPPRPVQATPVTVVVSEPHVWVGDRDASGTSTITRFDLQGVDGPVGNLELDPFTGDLKVVLTEPGGDYLSEMTLGPDGRTLFIGTTDAGVQDKFAVFNPFSLRSLCAFDIPGRLNTDKPIATARGKAGDFLIWAEPGADLLIVLALQ